jgi:hypothetical protein
LGKDLERLTYQEREVEALTGTVQPLNQNRVATAAQAFQAQLTGTGTCRNLTERTNGATQEIPHFDLQASGTIQIQD